MDQNGVNDNKTADTGSSGKVRILTAGDRALSVSFGNAIDVALNSRVRTLRTLLEARHVDGIRETVPTYASLTVHYEPAVMRREELIRLLSGMIPLVSESTAEPGPVKEIPVLYGGETGQDLAACAEAEGKTEEEIIRIHTSHEHYVYMLGFNPGHPYSARSVEPFSFGRRETPRVSIRERSVVVQRNLTNITPFAQPCGWQVIGSTPLTLTDYNRDRPFLLEAGDRLRFRAVSQQEYDRLRTLEEEKEKKRKAQQDRADSLPPAMEVLLPGFMSTIQDEGRFGYQACGVSPAGPMDRRAFHLANLLAGNLQGAAALEMCMTGPEILTRRDTVFAVCGADFMPLLDGVPVPSYAAVPAKAGQVISFSPCRRGRYGYLAFAGGIRVPEIMGSRSTLMKNKLGGIEGRKLSAGDRFATGAALPENPGKRRLVPEIPAAKEETVTLRVVKGPQDDMFTKESLRYFMNHGAVVSDSCDRQGARMIAEPLAFRDAKDIVSDGISIGAIQVPGDGQPILLLSDRQTTGGYAKPCTVITVDLGKAAQLVPGQKVRFVEVSPRTAEDLYLREYYALRKLEEEWHVQY